ncbi:MAG: hypothetical protein M9927_12740 [Anaerolineae bacterium]|nr:hypothetical protein [Anaerolineae bacterium]
MKRSSAFVLIMVIALLLAPMIANAAPSPTTATLPSTPPAGQQTVKSPDAACALLDDAQARATMSGMFETKLLLACGRANELGGVTSDAPANYAPNFGTDVLVNNPALDSGSSRTQSETIIARNENTGTICSAYNDSYGGVTAGVGYTGFSSSTDSGATFTDHGGLGANSFGDPGLIWRKSDGKFYLGTLHTAGIGFWRSDDDCNSFTFIGNPHSSANDDKELFAVDNNVASPHYGRIYMAWTDFTTARIYVTFSDNTTTWSVPVAVSGAGIDVQGAWPTVAPNGDVYVAWVRWNPYSTGPIDIEVVRSTNGGASFSQVTNPLTGGINPRASTPTASCGRPALNGNIRYLPSPQITVSPNGDLHVVYVRDPDGLNVGDVINVYYRRSTDSGATWGPEVLLNDDGTTTDQFFPTISAGPGGRIVSTWYDRRLDTANNLLFDYYMRASDDGGVTWQASVRVTDGSSGVVLDPNLATCYHGDYDGQVQTAGTVLVQWSDDRQVVNGTDPNVYFDTQAFAPDYTLSVTPDTLSVCAPSDAAYTVDVGSVLGYTDPVTLSASGNPAGTTTSFSVNPVTPAGTSTLTIGNTGAASAGSSNITVSAASTSGPKTGDVTLNLFTAAAGQPVLTAPANGASNVPVPPTFTWNVPAQAGTYSIQIATDAGFSNIVDQASGLTDPTYTAAAPLNTNTLYYWRVMADNTCGASAYSTVFSFRTVAAPGDCAVGSTPNILYQYGFESGAGGWTSSGTGNTWAIAATNPHSGASHFHANDPATVSDQRLVSPAVAIPTGQNPVTLKFWHVPNLEPSGAAACFDGGILEVSVNDGVNWVQVPQLSLLAGQYHGVVSNGYANPLGGLNAWCGTTGYMNSIADVSQFAGQTVRFALRLGSDTSAGDTGWDVDDVTVQSCQPANIDVSPLSMSSMQAANTTTNQTLTVANTGGGTLNWQIAEEPVALPENAGQRVPAQPAATCDNPADVSWLSLSPASGSNAGGANTPVTVAIDSTGLPAGIYTANLCVTSNDPDPGPGNGAGLVVVPVQLMVDQSCISGTVYAYDPSQPMPGAHVQVCSATDSCNVAETDGAGQYAVCGLDAGEYDILAFPAPNRNVLPATLGPVTLPASTVVGDQDLILVAPAAPPAGTTITNIGIASSGLPVVYWASDLTLTTHGCTAGTASYEVDHDGGIVRSGTMAEGPDGVYTAVIPQLQPVHGYATIRVWTATFDRPASNGTYGQPVRDQRRSRPRSRQRNRSGRCAGHSDRGRSGSAQHRRQPAEPGEHAGDQHVDQPATDRCQHRRRDAELDDRRGKHRAAHPGRRPNGRDGGCTVWRQRSDTQQRPHQGRRGQRHCDGLRRSQRRALRPDRQHRHQQHHVPGLRSGQRCLRQPGS